MLDDLLLTRSPTNPFRDKIEFDNWADKVSAEISDDEKNLRIFKNQAATVETMYALKADPLNAINKAIGHVNEVAMVRARTLPVAEKADQPVEVSDNPREHGVADNAARQIVRLARAWLQKLWDTESLRIVSGLVLVLVIYLIKLCTGISLK